MKKIYNLSIFILIIILTFVVGCEEDGFWENIQDNLTYSTNDLKGSWKGDLRIVFHGGSNDGLDTIYTSKLTFGSFGKLISMEPSPIYESISGKLRVNVNGNINDTIITTHETDFGLIETTYMNWTGSSFESKTKINTDMIWLWNSGDSGNYEISGSLLKQNLSTFILP